MKKQIELESPMEDKKESKKMEKYELDNHVDTLVKAHDIMSDPELHKAVKEHASKKAKKISSIDQLRALAKKMKD